LKQVRTRFAPSPTGYLHIGGLRTALYAYLFAKNNNGRFILRIEDTDRERYVEGAEDVIYNSLKETGLYYDEGPDVGGDFGPYIQSQRKHIYAEYAQKLIERGGAYRCFCSKERLNMLKEKGVSKYDKHCLNLSSEQIEENLKKGMPYVIRQNISPEGVSKYTDLVFGEISVENKDMEDNILIKSDGMPTYNFANVIDDYLMQINYVIRGTEYLSSTPKYNLIYDAFGWERPNYIHLPPVMRDAEHKLSKRYNDPGYHDLIEEGFLKEALINYIALLGWNPKNNQEKMSFEELKSLFSLEGLSKSPAIFDKQKLLWLNGVYIKEMSEEDFHSYAMPYYKKSKLKDYDFIKISRLLHTRIEAFSQIPRKIDFLEEFRRFDVSLYNRDKLKTNIDIAKKALPQAARNLAEIDLWDIENINNALAEAAQQLKLKKGQVMWCVRIALTGQEVTPGGSAEMAEILGKQRALKRLNNSMEWLNNN
jgi:glutamyl-tRNA synthetase